MSGRPRTSMRGKRFGNLLVLGYAQTDPKKQLRIVCKCICGKQVVVIAANVRRGYTKSCGCKQWKKVDDGI